MASLTPLSSWTATGVTRALAAVRRVQPPANSFLAGPRRRDVATLVSQPLRFRSKSPGTSLSARCFSALSPEMKSTIDKVVQSHKVVLFMKGTKDFPQCGFSNTVVQILKSLNVPFETLNILENDMLRQGMKEYSSWPTFPQLYIDGEFFGGCDITIVATILEYAIIERELGSGKMSVSRIDTKRSCSAEAYKNGQLQEQIEKAMCS